MISYRTELAAFALDHLDFIESKLAEARDDEASQKAAVIEAGGAIPQLRGRLWAEDPTKATQCVLFRFFDDDWWARLATMDREHFLQELRPVLCTADSEIATARVVLAQPSAPA